MPRENVFQAQGKTRANGLMDGRASSGGNYGRRQQGWDLVSNGERTVRQGWSSKLGNRSCKSPQSRKEYFFTLN